MSTRAICRSAGALFALSCAVSSVFAQTSPEPMLRGSRFVEALNQPLLVTREDVAIAEILDSVSQTRRIEVLLDRRIDPGIQVDAQIRSQFFDEGIEQLISPMQAGVTVVADTVFVTLPETAHTLRTRIALVEERMNVVLAGQTGRQFEMARRSAIHWPRLARPRDIVVRIASSARLTIENPDAIPHDLWRTGGLTDANPIEALMVVAAQFDLTVEPVDGSAIRFVPQTADPIVAREHRLRGMTPEEAQARILAEFPELSLSFRSSVISAEALLEQHERIAVLLGIRPERKPAAPVLADSLRNRRFSLQLRESPFLDLIKAMQSQGLDVQLDNPAIAKANIDLTQRLSLQLEDATIEQLLDAACTPLGLTYFLNGTQIQIFPKSSESTDNPAAD